MTLSRRKFLKGTCAALLFAAAGGDLLSPASAEGAKKNAQHPADPNIDARRIFLSRRAWPPKDILNFHGKLSPGFHDTIVKSWKNIPSSMRGFITDGGYAYDFGTTMDEVAHGKVPQPVDPTDRRTNDQCFAQAFSQKWDGEKRVMIAEYELQGLEGVDPQKEKTPTIEKINSGIWKRRIEDTPIAFNHETGHAINYCVEELTGMMLSDTPEFMEAYKKDLEALGGVDGAEKKGYGYFTAKEKDVRSCRDEVMAEILADTCGGCYSGKGMIKDWPSCNSYVSEAMKQFETAYKVSGLTCLKQVVMDKVKIQPEKRSDRRRFLSMITRAASRLSC